MSENVLGRMASPLSRQNPFSSGLGPRPPARISAFFAVCGFLFFALADLQSPMSYLAVAAGFRLLSALRHS